MFFVLRQKSDTPVRTPAVPLNRLLTGRALARKESDKPYVTNKTTEEVLDLRKANLYWCSCLHLLTDGPESFQASRKSLLQLAW